MAGRGPDLLQAGAIDWDAPWFAPVADCGRALAAEPDLRRALTRAAGQRDVRNACGHPVRFVAPEAAGERAYEEHIALTGEVPTRDNLHDFFNALMWLTFPRSKARLNALQAAAIARDGIGPRRGPLRDAATLFDENAALLLTQREDLVDALAAHEWRRLFVDQRSAWTSEVRVVVFGHALLEKLTRPYRGVTAHAFAIALPADASPPAIDAAVSDVLDARLAPQGLLPLPVMGIPGWAPNDDAAFYDDAAVFRPARPTRTEART
jgi:hypothetical protein